MSTENYENETEGASVLPPAVVAKFAELAELCTANNITLTTAFTVANGDHATDVGVRLVGAREVLKQAQNVPELALLYAALFMLQHTERPGREMFDGMDSKSVSLAMALEAAVISNHVLTEGPLLVNAEYMEMREGEKTKDDVTGNDDLLQHVDKLARKMGLDT